MERQLSNEHSLQLVSLLKSQPSSSVTSNSPAVASMVSYDGNSFSSINSVSSPDVINSKFWVLDIDATHHVCNDISCFTYSFATTNSYVNLPTGESIAITRIGFVALTPSITISHVLFVPEFKFNLISISSLTTEHNFVAQFSSSACIIQGNTQGKMIRMAKKHGNLYIL